VIQRVPKRQVSSERIPNRRIHSNAPCRRGRSGSKIESAEMEFQATTLWRGIDEKSKDLFVAKISCPLRLGDEVVQRRGVGYVMPVLDGGRLLAQRSQLVYFAVELKNDWNCGKFTRFQISE
jgi:hypothetical protein